MSNTAELTALGQSIWLDYIRRDLIETGELADLIRERNVRGVTSNPSIFQKAISGSDLYTSTLRRLAWAGYGPESALRKIYVLQRIFSCRCMKRQTAVMAMCRLR